jgi:hypothetical protein
MSTAINYASIPVVAGGVLTTGDTSRTAPTTTTTIFNSSNGGQVERITITPVATTIASVVRIFRYDGTAYHLYTEVQIGAQTLVAGTAVVPQTLEAVDNPNLFPILIPVGWSLRATVNDTQTGIQVQAEGGGY